MSRKTPSLERAAAEAVDETLAALPKALQEPARGIPVAFEPRPSAAMIEDGTAEDTLGLFVGESFVEQGSTSGPLPAQIILFLDNLWEEAEHDLRRYREEVRTTFLHELGHYLGLEELDLEERGLE